MRFVGFLVLIWKNSRIRAGFRSSLTSPELEEKPFGKFLRLNFSFPFVHTFGYGSCVYQNPSSCFSHSLVSN